MRHFFDCHGADRETGIFEYHNGYELEEIIRRQGASVDTLPSSAQLSEVFLRIFHTCIHSEETRQNSVTKTYFEFSANYIKTNLHLPISVQDLCRSIGITQPYLYRIFKQEAGCSPKQYILGCKLDRAKKLLVTTDLSVSRIADSVGFSNVLDFSKFFSKQTGFSPTAYRIRG